MAKLLKTSSGLQQYLVKYLLVDNITEEPARDGMLESEEELI